MDTSNRMIETDGMCQSQRETLQLYYANLRKTVKILFWGQQGMNTETEKER